ncbi:ABC transporter permease [Bauldia sp.]|uniref:ABC transporter permease n=1 Tax=Bauldia sp. TaxID=2575872 RepID=UPI003BA841AA
MSRTADAEQAETPAADDKPELSAPRSLYGDAWRDFRASKTGMFGLIVATLCIVIAIFAPWIAPYGYAEQDWTAIREGPSWEHLMGTDAIGRDLFSRILMGIRTAVFLGFVVSFVTAIIGILIGSIGPLIGGWVDTAVVWVIDGLLNFPALWLAAFAAVVTKPIVAAIAGPAYAATGWDVFSDTVFLDYLVVFTCLSLVWWAPLGRLVRGQVLSIREEEFIAAQKSIGASRWWIITRHLAPNVLGQVIIHLSAGIGTLMLAESALSFLGIGIQPPGASLGNLIFSGISTWRSDPHLVAMPGFALSLIILAFVFIGDALNDALNPRLRTR